MISIRIAKINLSFILAGDFKIEIVQIDQVGNCKEVRLARLQPVIRCIDRNPVEPIQAVELHLPWFQRFYQRPGTNIIDADKQIFYGCVIIVELDID
jgi:hypothetical protein